MWSLLDFTETGEGSYGARRNGHHQAVLGSQSESDQNPHRDAQGQSHVCTGKISN